MAFMCKRCSNNSNQGVLDYCFSCIKVIITDFEEDDGILHPTEQKYPEMTTRFKEMNNYNIEIAENELLQKLTEIQHKFGHELLKKSVEKFETSSHVLRFLPREEVRKIHPTEEKYPEQTKRFKEILDELYLTHLKKNNDYSKWNVLGVGIVGLGTRFWDKTCRIMNLIGFDITTGEYSGLKINLVEDEKLEDTFRDAGVYAIIARIYLEGKWGK